MQLPVRQSTVERPVQETAGIFQFGTAQLMPSVEALTLAGAIASATGAPLGDPEFDVHTWLRERFVALGCPQDNAVPFTGHALQSALYGYKSGQTRKLLMRALDNLTRAFVTIRRVRRSARRTRPRCGVSPAAAARGRRRARLLRALRRRANARRGA